MDRAKDAGEQEGKEESIQHIKQSRTTYQILAPKCLSNSTNPFTHATRPMSIDGPNTVELSKPVRNAGWLRPLRSQLPGRG
eukprot:1149954-Pelagomonas_calceolata.AAC.1